MKQRITYIVQDPDSFSPDQLVIKGSSLTLKHVEAAKEHRIIAGLDDLPSELHNALSQLDELHIRWSSSNPYTASPPFTSRVTPGLHVFFTPRKDSSDREPTDLLRSAFGIAALSMSFRSTKMPILSERFSMSTSSQYYSYIDSLSNLVKFIQNSVCKSEGCRELAKSLMSATYVDIDFDAISNVVVFNAFSAVAPDTGYWDETISVPSGAHTAEVGVLIHEKNPDPEDIGFGGFLTVLGQDQAPKGTRFQTPARHYPLSSTAANYKASFSHPTGLHPTLTLTFPYSQLTPPEPTCKLHTYLTLPSYLFLDKYQFSDALYLASNNLKSLRSVAGATDLEDPDWATTPWGSTALLELAIPKISSVQKKPSEWNVTVPLHLRYLRAAEASHSTVPVPWPVVFWACKAEEGTKMNTNPFDRVHLGYEALFGRRTRFMHIPPAAEGNGTGGLVEWIDVPVLDLRKSEWVKVGTTWTVIFAFIGLCWALFGNVGGSKAKKENVKEKKKQ